MIETTGLGLRDGILLAAGLAGIYLVFMWLRLQQLRRHRRQEPLVAGEPEIRIGPDWPAPGRGATRAEPVESIGADAQASPPSFADQLRKSGVEVELAALKAELRGLRRDHEQMKEELDKMKAARHVSPLYSEAMGFAQKGIDAAGIASRCGISVAEAELVAALARKPDDTADVYLDEDDHDESNRRRVA